MTILNVCFSYSNDLTLIDPKEFPLLRSALAESVLRSEDFKSEKKFTAFVRQHKVSVANLSSEYFIKEQVDLNKRCTQGVLRKRIIIHSWTSLRI